MQERGATTPAGLLLLAVRLGYPYSLGVARGLSRDLLRLASYVQAGYRLGAVRAIAEERAAPAVGSDRRGGS